jgi:hypothetical protein
MKLLIYYCNTSVICLILFFLSLKFALFASVSSVVLCMQYLEENAIMVNIDRFVYYEKSFKVAW